MHPLPLRIRRARRTDLPAVLRILADTGRPVPPPERRFLRRFRRVVSDLGADLRVATRREAVVGCVHVTYARQVLAGQRARVELLAAAPGERPEVAERLLEEAIARALRRECASVALDDPHAVVEEGTLQRLGFDTTRMVPVKALAAAGHAPAAGCAEASWTPSNG